MEIGIVNITIFLSYTTNCDHYVLWKPELRRYPRIPTKYNNNSYVGNVNYDKLWLCENQLWGMIVVSQYWKQGYEHRVPIVNLLFKPLCGDFFHICLVIPNNQILVSHPELYDKYEEIRVYLTISILS